MRHIEAMAIFLAGSSLCSLPVVAGPGLPCIAATLSANGKILVTDTLTFDDPDETQSRRIMGSVYQVYRRYEDPNEYLVLKGPNGYWADPFWKVETKRTSTSFPIACSYVLVPDDGEYLIFVGTMPGADALTIYHHRPYDPAYGPLVSQQGAFVRQIQQYDLWPSDPRDLIYTDHTPKWFADGKFSFSADQRTLYFQDKQGRGLAIELATGAITHPK